MRKTILIAAAIVALASNPALAQGRGGGGGGGGAGGGGAGGGMGAGPPIAPPGRSGGDGASTRAQDIAAQRGQFGRDFAEQQRNRALPDQANAMAQDRRAQALQYAAAARAGRPLPANAARDIRAALKDDMVAWREQFRVGRSEWQAMRDQWIADRDSMTAAQWAERRAAWFDARDAWIATHRDRVQTRN